MIGGRPNQRFPKIVSKTLSISILAAITAIAGPTKDDTGTIYATDVTVYDVGDGSARCIVNGGVD